VRESLKGVLSRVDRLANRLRPSAEDWAAKLRTMSDQELDEQIMELARKAGGPDALYAELGLDLDSPVLGDLRRRWERIEG
jgi:hypothetical protein